MDREMDTILDKLEKLYERPFVYSAHIHRNCNGYRLEVTFRVNELEVDNMSFQITGCGRDQTDIHQVLDKAYGVVSDMQKMNDEIAEMKATAMRDSHEF
jgi:hypothetical protein